MLGIIFDHKYCTVWKYYYFFCIMYLIKIFNVVDFKSQHFKQTIITHYLVDIRNALYYNFWLIMRQI